MAVQDVIEQIKLAEEKAEQIVSKANAMASEILSQAEKNAKAVWDKAVSDSALDKKDSLYLAEKKAKEDYAEGVQTKQAELLAKREQLTPRIESLSDDVVGRIV